MKSIELSRALASAMSLRLPGTVGKIANKMRYIDDKAPLFVEGGLIRRIEAKRFDRVHAVGVSSKSRSMPAFEVFEEIDAQLAHKVNAARYAECAQPIELETIGRSGFFAKFLFAGCAETLDAIIDARTVDLLVLAVLQKRLPLRLCHRNNVRSGALTGNVSRFGIPVDPQRTIAIHVLAFGCRCELKLVNGASFRVAAIEG